MFSTKMNFPNLKKDVPIKAQKNIQNIKQTGMEKKVTSTYYNQNTKYTKQIKNIKSFQRKRLGYTEPDRRESGKIELNSLAQEQTF